MKQVSDEIAVLYRQRPKSYLARIGWSLFLLLLLSSWSFGNFGVFSLFSAERGKNVSRFLSELVPYPLASEGFSFSGLYQWLAEILAEKGFSALAASFGISIVAIVIAGITALALSIFSARSIATSEPYIPGVKESTRWWSFFVYPARFILVFFRAIPEYLWAFIFLSIFGISAWPGILALAVHNAGVLGKLNSELIENLPNKPLAALRAVGGRRSSIALFGVLPLLINRFLLLFFYRWETCIRESTVLGFLGIASLAYWVEDARARNFYDEMFLFVILGSILVVIGDIASGWARRFVARSGV